MPDTNGLLPCVVAISLCANLPRPPVSPLCIRRVTESAAWASPVRRSSTRHRSDCGASAVAVSGKQNPRQLVNEVFGPLVTKFVRNFGREGATPIQRGSNASLLGRVQAVEPSRHSSLGHLMTND